jgi:hypothetical protein
MIDKSDRVYSKRSRTTRSYVVLLRSISIRVSGAAFLGLAIALGLVSFERHAFAYTDPGSGALIWQMLAAGFVGAAFYFRRFLTWLKGKRTDLGKTAGERQQEDAADGNDQRS